MPIQIISDDSRPSRPAIAAPQPADYRHRGFVSVQYRESFGLVVVYAVGPDQGHTHRRKAGAALPASCLLPDLPATFNSEQLPRAAAFSFGGMMNSMGDGWKGTVHPPAAMTRHHIFPGRQGLGNADRPCRGWISGCPAPIDADAFGGVHRQGCSPATGERVESRLAGASAPGGQ